MTSITISELSSAGSELFQDSESFLNELNDQEMDFVIGGRRGHLVKVKINFIFNVQVTRNLINNQQFTVNNNAQSL